MSSYVQFSFQLPCHSQCFFFKQTDIHVLSRKKCPENPHSTGTQHRRAIYTMQAGSLYASLSKVGKGRNVLCARGWEILRMHGFPDP